MILSFAAMGSRQVPVLFAITAALCSLTAGSRPTAAAAEKAASIAVIDFNYVDTSGEPRDQQAEHAARLAAFMAALKRDLVAAGHFRLVAPACGAAPCSVADTTEQDLLQAARRAGADFVLIGGVRKMSTLVQWAKVEVVQVRSERIVLDKLFTFRGDTDEAWKRAEAFIADECSMLRTSP